MDLKILALVFNFVLICWPKTNLILLSSFEEEDFQRFTLNLLRLNFGYYFANNASGAAT